jgi:DNA helicase-2/ATP-dependent DNA helicase PcrA
MAKNKLLIASAGSGKTRFIVDEALKQIDGKVLITTYTQANEEEIRKRILAKNKCIPENITIQTWFSFLIQHGAKPYQGYMFEGKINGLILVNSQSAVKFKSKSGFAVCYKEDTELEKHYFTPTLKIYSDKLSKFVIKCNELSEGAVINRLSKLYSTIFIDEIQDLAGYDLEILKQLFLSKSNILLVGDPRQVTYLTHNERKYSKYSNGLIKTFIENECKKIEFEIDDETLSSSYRSNKLICDFSSKLYPSLKACDSNQKEITRHDGIFLVRSEDITEYLSEYNPVQLRLNIETKKIDSNYAVFNFGESKGQTFDRVLIFPTSDMGKWLVNMALKLKDKTRAQFYVGITRAKFSVGIVYEYTNDQNIEGVFKYK